MMKTILPVVMATIMIVAEAHQGFHFTNDLRHGPHWRGPWGTLIGYNRPTHDIGEHYNNVLWHIAERICQRIWVDIEISHGMLTGDFWAAIARKSAWLQLCAHVCNLLSMSCFYSKLVKCQSEAVSSSFRLIFQPDHA